jgi:hypothetical protein
MTRLPRLYENMERPSRASADLQLAKWELVKRILKSRNDQTHDVISKEKFSDMLGHYLDCLRCCGATNPEIANIIQQVGQEEQEILDKVLDPFPFSADLRRMQQRFLPGTRKFVMQAFEAWLENADSRLFWISAGPGMGKSTVMAQLCLQYDSHIQAVHFCDHNNADRGSPRRVIQSLVHQLTQQFSEYREAIFKILPQLQNMQSGTLESLWELFTEPLNNLSPPSDGLKRVLLIDALDESEAQGGNSLLDILRTYLDKLPSWIGVAVSSRPETPILQRLKRFSP